MYAKIKSKICVNRIRNNKTPGKVLYEDNWDLLWG